MGETWQSCSGTSSSQPMWQVSWTFFGIHPWILFARSKFCRNFVVQIILGVMSAILLHLQQNGRWKEAMVLLVLVLGDKNTEVQPRHPASAPEISVLSGNRTSGFIVG